MPPRRKIAFIQLPLPDNDPADDTENLPLAAAYLTQALRSSPEHEHYQACVCPDDVHRQDDRHIREWLTDTRPHVIAATLYLWNVERTLHLLRAVRKARPDIHIVVGGPEVARPHPFLFRSRLPDVAVTGEGEAVFPRILRALRTGRETNDVTVAWRRGRAYAWGERPPPPVVLRDVLPPAGSTLMQPNPRGMAYMETTRGCPLSCAFCCYNQRRRRLSCLNRDEVIARVRALKKQGAREIRFIDPTFNANPRFESIVSALAKVNAGGQVEFFAELRAESLTDGQARLLAEANFRQVEVGVQSRNPKVLRAISRPTNQQALDQGVRRLATHGITVTLDIMCGLPHQQLTDVQQSLNWAAAVPHADVQFLHTLLIPGTSLRRRAGRLGLAAQARPPYRVLHTASLTAQDMQEAEREAQRVTGTRMDTPSQCFVGHRLPDLFAERIEIDLDRKIDVPLAGASSRRALLLRSEALFERRSRIFQMVRRSLAAEPCIQWQFVLCARQEEPLDLLDELVIVMREAPEHLLDRLRPCHGDTLRMAGRRAFVKLSPGRSYDGAWRNAAEKLLRHHFV